VYVPSGKQGADVYKKIYAKISADFYIDKAGDHSVSCSSLSQCEPRRIY
jgi:hypothetical protein